MLFFQTVRVLPLLRGACAFLLLPMLAFAQTASSTTTPPPGAMSASFLLTPSSGSFGVGKAFTVSVVVDAPQSFNSANATLNFDKEILSVSSVSKTSSAFSLWAVEPSFSNTAGTVSFEGGNTTPLSGKKTLLTISFKALKEGKAKVSFANGSVLAADGKGTDIAGTKGEANFDIAVGVAETPTPPPPPPPSMAAGGPVPDVPEVTTPTHPNENVYSSAPKAKFTWDLPADVTLVRLSLDTKEKTIPTTTYDPAIAEKEFDQLTDGVMYFHLRYKNDSGFGPTIHKKIMVDKTPPEKFPLEVIANASSTDVILKFAATDTLSGIDRYDVSVDEGTPVKVSTNDVRAGSYTLSSQPPGDHTVKVNALDKAGNSTIGEGKFSIVGDTTVAKSAVDTGEPKPTDWGFIVDIILAVVIAFLIGSLWYERNGFRHEKYMIKREADELRDNMGNIFAAVREEIGEQVGRLFDKPNPSAQDREVMERINEAVDLSEELLSKEVEDVRKLLI